MFSNPILKSRSAADPWVIWREGFYYFTSTFDADGLWVWRSKTLSALDDAERSMVWRPPASGARSAQIWAPELHFLQDRWYLYYTASDGIDANHRHYVLAATTPDPLGPYEDLGRVDPAFEHYAIDGSVLAMPDGRLYWMYAAGGLFIAPMSGPARVSGPGVKFADGTYDWERAWRKPPVTGAEWIKADGYWLEAPQALIKNPPQALIKNPPQALIKDPPQALIKDPPQALVKTGRVFVVYSAGHSATPHYCLGLLELEGSDPLRASAWKKYPDPVFGPYEGPDGAVYTVGHCCFTRSADGTEDWIVYHAKDAKDHHFGDRTPRAQPFFWNESGLPNFGRPIPAGVCIPRPSGEPDL